MLGAVVVDGGVPVPMDQIDVATDLEAEACRLERKINASEEDKVAAERLRLSAELLRSATVAGLVPPPNTKLSHTLVRDVQDASLGVACDLDTVEIYASRFLPLESMVFAGDNRG